MVEKEKITSFTSDLLGFVDKRTTASYRTMLYKNKRLRKKYKKYRNQAIELHEEIYRRLGGTKEAWLLIDEYEAVEGILEGIVSDQAYLQGLSDGFELRKLLDKGIF
ncbi:MAG: hypothetical protein HPY50_09420 [Firmicutes bacterium]|nr:hypothetical protein [Bacillota bacterium]